MRNMTVFADFKRAKKCISAVFFIVVVTFTTWLQRFALNLHRISSTSAFGLNIHSLINYEL